MTDDEFIEDSSSAKMRLEIKSKRFELLMAMGGKCCKCGFKDFRALQIDHVNGDGYIQRYNWKTLGGLDASQYYKIVKESFLKQENIYQLLCANCNWIKRHENREYRKPKSFNFPRANSKSQRERLKLTSETRISREINNDEF